MSLIIPVSALVSPTCSSYKAPTAANFPKLKHLFLCNEATGVLTLSDSIGNVVLKQSSGTGITNNGDGTVSWATNPMTLLSGTWTPPGTKNVIVVAVGKPTNLSTSSLGFGSAAANTNFGFNLNAQSTGVARVADGSGVNAVATAGTPATGTPAWTADGTHAAMALSLTFGSATGQEIFNWNGTNYGVQTPGSLAVTAAGGLASLDAAANFGVSFNPYMIAVLHFTTKPTDLKPALQFMYDQAIAATPNKVIWPGWAN